MSPETIAALLALPLPVHRRLARIDGPGWELTQPDGPDTDWISEEVLVLRPDWRATGIGEGRIVVREPADLAALPAELAEYLWEHWRAHGRRPRTGAEMARGWRNAAA
jgi:GNAT superfamily N-acetyltransferase